MSTMTAPPTACTCLNRFDHCAHCRALESAVRPPVPPMPKPPRRPYHRKPVPPPEPTQRLLLSATEVARLCSIGVRTLWRMTAQGQFPQPKRWTRKLVRWVAADVEAWIAGMSNDAPAA